MNADASLGNLLDAVAAKRPTPGGGAVAAICGALAAATGEMVLNYSIGRKATPQFDAPLGEQLAALTRARTLLLRLMEEDQEAFATLTEIKKSPDTPDKATRVAEAQQVCIAVPQEITVAAIQLLTIADAVAEMSNRYVLSDLAVCCELAMATVRSGLHNVRVNVGTLDAGEQAKLLAWCDAQLARAIELVNRAMPKIDRLMRDV